MGRQEALEHAVDHLKLCIVLSQQQAFKEEQPEDPFNKQSPRYSLIRSVATLVSRVKKNMRCLEQLGACSTMLLF